MTYEEALILIKEIEKSGYNLTPKDQSVINGIEMQIAGYNKKPISDRQSWALQKIYRQVSGGGQYQKREYGWR